MSSLRLALKQSLQESGLSHGSKQRDQDRRQREMINKRKREKRRPGDPPRKRGRPRKHPLPEPPKPKPNPQPAILAPSSEEEEATLSALEDTDTENEFSVSNESENSDNNRSEETSDAQKNTLPPPPPPSPPTPPPPPPPSPPTPPSQESQEGDEGNASSDKNSQAPVLDIDENELAIRKHKRLLKKQRLKQRNMAAAKIQSHLKKKWKASPPETETPQEPPSRPDSPKLPAPNNADEPSSDVVNTTKQKKLPSTTESMSSISEGTEEPPNLGKAETVPPPDIDLVDWIAGLSTKKQRRSIARGMRVKVRFSTETKKRDGKITRRRKWYGGLITGVSTGGSMVRIKYDDGTSELTKFPDKDVIVDDERNGRHKVPADVFYPRKRIASESKYDDWKVDNTRQHVDALDREQNDMFSRSRDSRSGETEDAEREFETDHRRQSLDKPVPEEIPFEAEESEPTNPSHRERASATEASQQPATVREREPPRFRRRVIGDVEMDKKARAEDPRGPTQPEMLDPALGAKSSPINSENSHVASHEINERDAVFAPFDQKPSSLSREVSDESRREPVASKAEDEPRKPLECLKVMISGSAEQTKDNYGGKEREKFCSSSKTSEESSIVAERLRVSPVRDAPMKQALDDSTEDESLEELTAIQQSRKRTYEPGDELDGHNPKKLTKEVTDDIESQSSIDGFGASEQQEQSSEVELESSPQTRPLNLKADVDLGASTSQNQNPRRQPEPTNRQFDSAGYGTATAKPHKRKREDRERAVSPKGVGRLSHTRTPRRSDSPKPFLSEIISDGVPTRPVSTIARSIKVSSERNESILEGDDCIEIATSRNSAFDRKEKQIKERKSSHLNEHVVDDGNLGKEASGGASRSGRRAAQQANERIASRQELVIQEQFPKPKKRRVDREARVFAGGRVKRRREIGEGSQMNEDDHLWVQCDACSKWRVLPSSVDLDKLPKLWYCEMNVYDSRHNSCDAPEQTAEDIAKAKRKARRRLARRARQEAELSIMQEDTHREHREHRADRLRERGSRSPVPSRREASSKTEEKRLDNAEAKGKRSSPVLSVSEASGDQSPRSESSGSDCHKLEVGKKPSIGSRRERGDADTEDLPSDSVEAVVPRGRPRGRGRRVGKEVVKEQVHKDQAKGNPDRTCSSKEAENQEWVQCEKCEKWRRLPPHVSADDLPDVWYCSMNTWDPAMAHCTAAEDKADPNTREYTIIGQANPPQTTGHKLSYRSLIFGTGRKQNRPVSERMRAAESLFAPTSFVSPDQIGQQHPTVMYASSSLYVPRSQQRSGEEEQHDGLTFLDIMGNSNLWAELRSIHQGNNGAANKASAQNGGVCEELSYASMPQSLKPQLKELVFHALGNGILACHDVVLHVQCRPWESQPKLWSDLQSFCSFNIVMAALVELVSDGRLEVVGECAGSVSLPKFRRALVRKANNLSAVDNHTNQSRCMKIAKPWKRPRGNDGVDAYCA